MHPVFDVPKYPFHLKEPAELYRLLCDSYTLLIDIELIYSGCGNVGTELPQLVVNNVTGAQVWTQVLNGLAKSKRVKLLFDAGLLLAPAGPGSILKQAIEDVVNMKSAVHETVINIDTPVLDRDSIREFIMAMAAETHTKQVILVQGGPKSGKSYTRYLFEAMARQLQAYMVYLHSYTVVTLQDVLEELFGDTALIPQGNSTQPGWYGSVCRKLRTVLELRGQQMWIAVDDLGFSDADRTASIMDPDIREFFNQFVHHMASPNFRKVFKLLLINYPGGSLPVGWIPDHFEVKEVKVDDINKEAVQKILKNWYDANKKQVLLADLESEAARIIAEADQPPVAGAPAPPPRLERIQSAVKQLLQKP
jgi:hypothetical protein